MAETSKQYTIRIGTEGDPSGAKEVEKAIDNTTDATRELGAASDAVESFTSGGTTSITVEFRDAAKAAKELADAVDDAAKATKDFSDAPALPFVPSKVQPATEAVEDLAEAVQEVVVQGKKLEDLPKTPIKPADVKPAQGSLAALREELQRLQREIEMVPVGGKRFIELGQQVKVAEKDLRDAELQARKLGGSLGRSGSTGLAVLEFSRLLEDSQYGIRGILNNIPTLMMQLGLSGGLAGAVSIVAVGATQMWEAFSDSKSAEEAVDRVKEAAEKLVGRLTALRDRAKEIGKISLGDITKPLTEETTALKLQTQGFKDNIQALKDRLKAQQALDAMMKANDLANVDREEQSGKITADEAAKKRADIERQAAERKISQTEELAQLDDEVARELKAAAERELTLAKFRKELADTKLAEANAERDALAEEQRRRVDIERLRQEVEGADAALRDLGVDESRRNAGGRERYQRDADSPLSGPLIPLYEKIVTKIDALLAAQERLSAAEGEGLPRDPNVIAKAREKLNDELVQLSESVGAAAKAITDKEAALALATQSSEAALDSQADQRQDRANINSVEKLDALQAQLDAAGERSAERIGQTLEQILSTLGEAANQPGVQAKAAQVRDIIKDGLQDGEEGETSKLLMQLVSSIKSSDTRRAGLLQQVIQALAEGATTDRNLESQIRSIRADVANLKQQQGNRNN